MLRKRVSASVGVIHSASVRMSCTGALYRMQKSLKYPFLTSLVGCRYLLIIYGNNTHLIRI
ncbi:hypothetical protein [Arachidicoccus ginsenosidimutans]|uniref:hypothetical protein n=1 Tax=Arachidicoccus sp. BS20 TaxID=1850526 RepID=UPI0012E82E32|nr:hypothetical protein [Arachidicoccus sp. BS20]